MPGAGGAVAARGKGVVLVNDSTFESEVTAPVNVVRLKATELAAEIGNPQAGTMVMVGAYAGVARHVANSAESTRTRDWAWQSWERTRRPCVRAG